MYKFLGYQISQKSAPLYIAEISCNHCGSLDNLIDLIDKAKKSRADIVKIQAYTADEMTMEKSYKIKKGIWKGRYLYDLYESAQTPPQWLEPAFSYARHIQIPIFSSVFGERSLSALEKVNCEAYKIASYEANDYKLIKAIIKTGKPVMLSTGCLSFAELQRTDSWFPNGYPRVYMHCVSKYPCKDEDANLGRILALKALVGDLHVGYSDHTRGSVVAPYAAALGAKFIEKHFYDPALGKSEDAAFSLTPTQFKNMVHKTNRACLITNYKEKSYDYEFKRSLYALKRIRPGELLSADNVGSRRPYAGMDAANFARVQGLRANTNIPKGTPLIEGYVEWK